jgi:hypothetical protein
MIADQAAESHGKWGDPSNRLLFTYPLLPFATITADV